jgi:hypothetical protein
MATSDDILRFWSPPGLDAGEETHRHQFITRCFTHMLEAAAGGELDY